MGKIILLTRQQQKGGILKLGGLNRFLDQIHILLPALLLALTFHEYAHAKAADLLGDPTPRRSGRLSVNPIDHLDPMGLLMIVFVGFGWARPVPINPFNFKGDRNRGVMLVSLAGPMANLLLAFISVFVYYFSLLGYFGGATGYMVQFSRSLIIYNAYLMVFNLLPLPPLDGSKILTSILPQRARYQFDQIEPYAPFILILLLITGTLPVILRPIANTIINTLQEIVLIIFNIFL